MTTAVYGLRAGVLDLDANATALAQRMLTTRKPLTDLAESVAANADRVTAAIAPTARTWQAFAAQAAALGAALVAARRERRRLFAVMLAKVRARRRNGKPAPRLADLIADALAHLAAELAVTESQHRVVLDVPPELDRLATVTNSNSPPRAVRHESSDPP